MRRSLAAAVLSFVTGSMAAQTPCTLKSRHIPISTPGAPAGPYRVNVSFGDSAAVVPVEVDTGSTGVVVAAPALPPDTPDAMTCRRPVITYTSSGIVEVGTWKRTTITFWDAAGTTKLATTVPIDVLAVTVVADPRKGTSHPATCQNGRCAPSMMGVGFDRGSGTPDLNPFLQLAAMTGSNATMQRGYVLTTGGITLGITNADIAGFGFVGLQKKPGPSGDWSTEIGSITTPSFTAVPGPTLVDTGITEMFIGHRPPPPDTAQGVSVSWNLSNGSRFTFVPESSTKVTGVHPPQGAQAFVNTGRTLLQRADYLYDADCGRVGFRPH